MRRSLCLIALLLLAAWPARAGILGDVGIGLYGGLGMPIEDSADAGATVGVRLKVLPVIPLLGFEGYYARVGHESPEQVWAQGDFSLVLDDDWYDVAGANVLVGRPGGVGLRYYGVAGVNFVEFDDRGSEELKYGGELGVGAELVPPGVGLGIEARATVMVLGWEDGPDRKLSTLTVGLNYYF